MVSNKVLYTLEIKSTKYLPIVIAFLYIINTTISYIGYNIEEFAFIGGMSLLPLGKLYLDSFTYKLCSHHRVFIYYVFIHNLISIIDYYTNYSIVEDRDLFLIHIILFGIFLMAYIILKRRHDFLSKNHSKISSRYCYPNRKRRV